MGLSSSTRPRHQLVKAKRWGFAAFPQTSACTIYWRRTSLSRPPEQLQVGSPPVCLHDLLLHIPAATPQKPAGGLFALKTARSQAEPKTSEHQGEITTQCSSPGVVSGPAQSRQTPSRLPESRPEMTLTVEPASISRLANFQEGWNCLRAKTNSEREAEPEGGAPGSAQGPVFRLAKPVLHSWDPASRCDGRVLGHARE